MHNSKTIKIITPFKTVKINFMMNFMVFTTTFDEKWDINVSIICSVKKYSFFIEIFGLCHRKIQKIFFKNDQFFKKSYFYT